MTSIRHDREGITVGVHGGQATLTPEVIAGSHRQEDIQWGREVVAGYVGGERLATISDAEFEMVAKELGKLVMKDNSELEQQAIRSVLGAGHCEEDQPLT